MALETRLAEAYDLEAASSRSVSSERAEACCHSDTCVEVVVLVFLDLVADFGLSVVVDIVGEGTVAVFVHSEVEGTDFLVGLSVVASGCCMLAEVVRG